MINMSAYTTVFVYHCMEDIFSTDISRKHRGKDNNMYTSTNEITLHLLLHIFKDKCVVYVQINPLKHNWHFPAGLWIWIWICRIRMFLGLRIRFHFSTRYGSRSGFGSFYRQAKLVRKPLFLLFCDFFMTFYLWKNYVYVASKSNKQKNLEKKNILLLLLFWRSLTKIACSGSVSQR